MNDKEALEYWGNPTFPAEVKFINSLSVNGFAPDSIIASITCDDLDELNEAVTRLNVAFEEGVEAGDRSAWGNQRKVCRDTIMQICREFGSRALAQDIEGVKEIGHDLGFVCAALVLLERGSQDFTERSEASLHEIRARYGLPRVAVYVGTGEAPPA